MPGIMEYVTHVTLSDLTVLTVTTTLVSLAKKVSILPLISRHVRPTFLTVYMILKVLMFLSNTKSKMVTIGVQHVKKVS